MSRYAFNDKINRRSARSSPSFRFIFRGHGSKVDIDPHDDSEKNDEGDQHFGFRRPETAAIIAPKTLRPSRRRGKRASFILSNCGLRSENNRANSTPHHEKRYKGEASDRP